MSGTAVVTGAGQGIGTAVAERLMHDGYDVLAIDVNEAQVREAATRLGCRYATIDVRDPEQVATLETLAPDATVLVNNAAIQRYLGVGVGVGVGVGACVTVTSWGLPVAPIAVIIIVPMRTDVPVLAVRLQLMVPEFVPLAPDVIESQLLPVVTAAVQSMVPEPVFDTLNDVVPEPTPIV